MTTVAQQLCSIEGDLQVVLPVDLGHFLERLEEPQFRVGNDEWEFWAKDPELADQMVDASRIIREEWGVAAVALAGNGLGDYLLYLPRPDGSLDTIVYVLAHGAGEIYVYVPSLAKIHTGVDFYGIPDDDCVYRMDEEGEIREGPAFDATRLAARASPDLGSRIGS